MDEHGQKMEQTAKKAGLTPQQLSDNTAELFKEMHRNLNIQYDDFIRTTEKRHKDSVAVLWKKMEEKGDIYLDKYAGWYSVRDEAYFGEEELTAGPDGKKLAPSGAVVEWVEEESFFFKLSSYQDKLLELYEKNPHFIQPSTRRNEVISFVKSGLRDLSVSRTTFNWGIQVPGHPKHVMYVWVDALSNYITALGYGTPQDELMKEFWPVDFHMIGKDIIRFHAIYWPAFLMSAGIPVPKSVFGHGFIYNRGEKMSKSVGNVISPNDLAKEYGIDAVRYFLLREVAFGQDGNFSHDAMVQRINGDLANDIGNLAQRSLSMINKNCNASVPKPGEYSDADKTMLKKAGDLLGVMRGELEGLQFHKALDAAWAVIGDANRYVDEQAPWGLKKTDPARMATVLYVLAEVVRQVAILVQPIMPQSMAKMLDQIAVPEDERTFACLKDKPLKPGTALPAPQGVFPRYVDSDAPAA
jgi:methionyl-tRNA synthetase